MRLIIFLFLVFFCFSACSVKQDALRVAGLYDKGTQLDVYLVARDGVNKDTLSKGEVLDGFFSLSAKMGSILFLEIYGMLVLKLISKHMIHWQRNL